MERAKKLLLAMLAAVLCLSLAACGGDKPDAADTQADAGADVPEQSAGSGADAPAPAELESYQDESGSFSISIPSVEGGWVQGDSGNEAGILLDNSDQSFTVMVQGLPKGQGEFDSLDSVVSFYREQALAGFGEPTAEEIAAPESMTAQAESYTAEQYGTKAKALVAFLEGENGYYVYTITGLAEQYDANIGPQRDAVQNFVENAG